MNSTVAVWASFRSCFGVFSAMSKYNLWGHALAIFTLMATLLVGLILLGASSAFYVSSLIHHKLETYPFLTYFKVHSQLWTWVLSFILFFPFQLLCHLLLAPLLQLLGQPLLSRLTAKTDTAVRGVTTAATFKTSCVFFLALGLPNLLKFICLAGLCFLLTLIPGIGWFAAPLGLLLSAHTTGQSILQMYFENQTTSYTQMRSLLAQHRTTALGVGLFIALFSLIPVVGGVFGLVFGNIAGALALKKDNT